MIYCTGSVSGGLRVRKWIFSGKRFDLGIGVLFGHKFLLTIILLV